MYAALARAVLDEAGPRPRGVGDRAAAPAASARLEGRAGRAADPRAALQCASAGALLTGPAAFFRSDAVRRRPGLAGRGAEPARAGAGRGLRPDALRARTGGRRGRGSGRRNRIGAPAAGARPRAAPSRAAAVGGAHGPRRARRRGASATARPSRSAATRSRRFAAAGLLAPVRRALAMSRGADALIVGGGLIGCAVAAELAARSLNVLVVERDEPGAEASGAAAGMLSRRPTRRSPLRSSTSPSRAGRSIRPGRGSCARRSGIDVGYRRTGCLRVVSDGEAPASRAASGAWQRAQGLSVEDRTLSASRSIPERLAPGVRAMVSFPDEAVVDPRRLTRAVWLLRRAPGRASAHRRRRSAAFRIERGACRGVETDAGRIEARTVVDAAGAWAAFRQSLPVPIRSSRSGARSSRSASRTGRSRRWWLPQRSTWFPGRTARRCSGRRWSGWGSARRSRPARWHVSSRGRSASSRRLPRPAS